MTELRDSERFPRVGQGALVEALALHPRPCYRSRQRNLGRDRHQQVRLRCPLEPPEVTVARVKEQQELAPVKEVARWEEAGAFPLGRHLQLNSCGSLVVCVQSQAPVVEENEETEDSVLIRKDWLGLLFSAPNANGTRVAFR